MLVQLIISADRENRLQAERRVMTAAAAHAMLDGQPLLVSPSRALSQPVGNFLLVPHGYGRVCRVFGVEPYSFSKCNWTSSYPVWVQLSGARKCTRSIEGRNKVRCPPNLPPFTSPWPLLPILSTLILQVRIDTYLRTSHVLCRCTLSK